MCVCVGLLYNYKVTVSVRAINPDPQWWHIVPDITPPRCHSTGLVGLSLHARVLPEFIGTSDM